MLLESDACGLCASCRFRASRGEGFLQRSNKVPSMAPLIGGQKVSLKGLSLWFCFRMSCPRLSWVRAVNSSCASSQVGCDAYGDDSDSVELTRVV